LCLPFSLESQLWVLDVKRLCTDVGKQTEIIKWADGRACFEVVPDFVREEWGVEEAD